MISFRPASSGCEKAFALAIDLNATGNEIGFAREDVAIAFGAGDFSGLFQTAEQALQFLLARGRPAELLEHFRHIGRGVIFLTEES
jgi:hypothetical protein